MAEKLTQMSVIEVLREQSGKRQDKLFSARVDHACYIIKQLTDDEINKVKSLHVFLDNVGKSSCLNNLDADLCGVIKELEKAGSKRNGYKSKAAISEVNKYVGGSARRKGFAAFLWALLGIGVAITVVFAFLDNFKVIDYGGMAAGAAGIIDLAIGALACIVERVSDAKHTKSMSAAQKADDAESYKNYTVIEKKNTSFNIFGFFNKTEQIIQDEPGAEDADESERE